MKTLPERGVILHGAGSAPRLSMRPLSLALAIAWASGNAAPPVNELPTGAQVRAGAVTVTQNAATMTVQQGSQRAVVDWNTFNVGSQAQVNFVQPGASSAILNRVLDSRPSEIFGRITSNGQVFLTNASGIYFGPNSSVDVGALVASTHGISNQDFMEGRLRLERNGSTGSVINAGRLNALVQEELGGFIALLAPEVRNEGVIIAKLGTAALAAGETITLEIAGSRTLASLTVTPSQIRALVANKNLVQAPGGLIVLSAQAASSLQGGVVTNSGRLEATGLAMRGGRIVLEASDRIENTGVIDASASAAGPAGSVSLNAPLVVNNGQIKVDAELADQAAGSVEILARQFVQGAGGSISAAALAAMGAGRGGRVAITASESVELGGSVLVVGGNAGAPMSSTVTGSSVTANGDGGEISVLAGTTISVNSAVLDASGANGGHIVLEGERTPPVPDMPRPNPIGLAVNGSSQLRSNGRRGRGGQIDLLGETIVLVDNTRLEAGGLGGGVVRVGGDWQGSGGVRQATQVFMAADAVIDVSATTVGSGGKVVLWSDVRNPASITSVHGTILATGGSESGDGGHIETSGHYLATAGIRVRASTTKGSAGLWLLDPGNITIDAAGPSGDIFVPNFDASQDSVILASDIQAVLDTGAPVIITNTAGGGGNITVNASITKSAGPPSSLVLKADGGQIILNNVTISATGGTTLNLDLLANGYAFTTSTLDLGPGATLSFGPSGPSFAAGFSFQGTFPGGNFTASPTTTLDGLTINSFATLGGLMIGSPTNTQNISITSAISINGPVMLQGGATNVNQPITAAGPINIVTTTGDIVVGADLTTSDGSPNAIVLNAGASAVPGGGGDPGSGTVLLLGPPNLTAGAGGMITIFTSSVAGSAGVTTRVGSGSGNFRYNSDETTANFTFPLTNASTGAANTGVNAIYREAPVLTVTPSSHTIVYGDGVPVYTYTLTNAVNGDGNALLVATTSGGPAWNILPLSSSAKVVVGTHDVSFGGGLLSGLGYSYTDNAGSTNELTVTPKPITASGITASGKVYDGTTLAALVTGGAALTGGAANSADNLFYTGDAVTLNAGGATGVFVTKNAGAGIPVVVTGLALAGADATNYTVSDASSATANITQKPLNVSGLTSANKVYDGTVTAAVGGAAALVAAQAPGAGSAIDGIPYNIDVVAIGGVPTGTFNSKDVATATTVIFAGLNLVGADAANYTLNPHPTAAQNITPKPVNVSGLTSANKVYDGTVAATVGGAAALLAAQAPGAGSPVDGIPYTGDLVNVVGPATATFNTKDVLTANTVSFAGLTLGGADAPNYTLNPHPTAAQNVTPKPLNVGGLTSANKVYDGTVAAAVGGAAALAAAQAPGAGSPVDGIPYTGDLVNVVGPATATFNSKDVLTATTVSFAGLTLGGADATNYLLNPHPTAAQTIAPKALDVSGLTSFNKPYDGTVTATVGGIAALIAAQPPGSGSTVDGTPYNVDVVAIGGVPTGTFNTKDVLTATTVNFAGLTLVGADAANYSLNAHPPAAQTISAVPMTITALNATKTADAVPYTGGNGVSFTTFLGTDSVIDLGGVLSYAGTSQGATAVGSYLITPLGYTSANYTISFASGNLSITAAAAAPAPAPTTTPVVLAPAPVVTTVPTLSTSPAPAPAPDLTGTSVSSTPTTTTSIASGTTVGSTSTSTSTASGTTSSTETLASSASGSSVTDGTTSTSESTSTTTSTTGGTSSGSDPLTTGTTVGATDATSTTTTGTTTTGSTTTAATTTGGTATTQSSTTSPSPSPTTATQTATASSTVTPPRTITQTAPAGTTSATTGGTAVATGGTAGRIAPTSASSTTQSTTQSTVSGGASRTITTASATTPTADPVVTKPPAAAVVTATATRLASIDAPAGSIDALVTARVQTAVGGGAASPTANRAGNAFSTALAQKLAQGQPMAQAMASAERAFQAESSVPPPRTPAVALSRAIAAGGGDVATSLSSVSPTKPGAGSAAFDRSLSAALARGVPMDAAVGAAKVAARQIEQAALADTTPRAQLASGVAASASPQSANPAFQKSLSSMLAQGISPQVAMARAGQAAEADAAAARADARNPSAGLASGRTEAIASGTPGGASEQVLALALARGEAPGPAMARAVEIHREEQAAVAADARQPQASLVRGGTTTLPERGADFDRALTNALGRGLSPEAALQVANRAADTVAPAPTPESALATGVGVEKLVAASGSSRTYNTVLSAALARKVPPAQAIELARRAEAANAFRFTVPASVARNLPANLSAATVTDSAGRPLPSWIRFNPATRQFIATEVPEGGLPIQAVVVAGQTRVPIVISDGPMPPPQRP